MLNICDSAVGRIPSIWTIRIAVLLNKTIERPPSLRGAVQKRDEGCQRQAGVAVRGRQRHAAGGCGMRIVLMEWCIRKGQEGQVREDWCGRAVVQDRAGLMPEGRGLCGN